MPKQATRYRKACLLGPLQLKGHPDPYGDQQQVESPFRRQYVGTFASAYVQETTFPRNLLSNREARRNILVKL